MSRRSPSSQTTMYRLRRVADAPLSSYVQEKYFEPDRDFAPRETQVGDVASLLVYGAMTTGAPKWTEQASEITGLTPDVSNMTSAGVLLIPYEDFIYALSWGMGFLILSPQYIDGGFGIRFAIRKADATRVRSVTTNAIDVLPRTAKTSILGGAEFNAFRVEDIGEVLNRMVVSVDSNGLACAKPDRRTWVTVRGADALNLPLGRSPHLLLRDIGFVHAVVERAPVVQGLEFLESTRPLRAEDPIVRDLEDLLESVLSTNDPERLALSWPAEWDDERGEALQFRFSGFGPAQNGTEDDLTLDDLLDRIEIMVQGHKLQSLKKGKIQALNHDGEAVSRSISANRWITFEHDLNGERYIYSRGLWYSVGGSYLDSVRERVALILSQTWQVTLPEWRSETKRRKKTGELYRSLIDEGDYNLFVAKDSVDYTCLDKKFLYTNQHPRGFEACDLFGPSGELIHVKNLKDSVSASHLFNQAQVSAEGLKYQPDAIERLGQKISEVSDGVRSLQEGYRPKTVVLAFAGRDASVDSLFTFSQMNLLRCAQRLNAMDIELKVCAIASLPEDVAKDESERP
jgi:uncharacterized protein (TIGR04141 family)